MVSNYHHSVMFEQSLQGLNIKPDGIYVDATFGRGGHTRGLLAQLGKSGKVIAFDCDLEAVKYAKENLKDRRLELVHSTFSQMGKHLKQRHLNGKINGILMDLGVSSPQLDNAERGFSFSNDGALDMRMDQTSGDTAAQWLANADETEIANIIYQFGDERKSRHIARAIKQYQQQQAIKNTAQLAAIIKSVVRTNNGKHPATRSFQAIRIFINQELQQLTDTLAQSIDLLSKNARLLVISFHSAEDRIVKQFIQNNSRQTPIPKGLPIMNVKLAKMPLKDLGKQKPSAKEVISNPRSRSAILRLAERL